MVDLDHRYAKYSNSRWYSTRDRVVYSPPTRELARLGAHIAPPRLTIESGRIEELRRHGDVACKGQKAGWDLGRVGYERLRTTGVINREPVSRSLNLEAGSTKQTYLCGIGRGTPGFLSPSISSPAIPETRCAPLSSLQQGCHSVLASTLIFI